MEIRYIKHGDIPIKHFASDGARGAVIALHGFGGSKESAAIELLAKRLCPLGIDVAAPDWEAHGERGRDFSRLSVDGCISDLRAAERFVRENISDNIGVFSTSFGGYIALLRAEQDSAAYRRVVLRVPAVDMANSMINAARLSDPSASAEKARSDGYFTLRMAEEFHVPYRLYEELSARSCVRRCPAWSGDKMIVIYAENDELVSRADTEEFLRLNDIPSKMITGTGHRMMAPEKLSEALDAAAEFLGGIV